MESNQNPNSNGEQNLRSSESQSSETNNKQQEKNQTQAPGEAQEKPDSNNLASGLTINQTDQQQQQQQQLLQSQSFFYSIFSPKSKSVQAQERFKMSSQQYLDHYKVSVYLQDAIKVILDRRQQRPLETLVQYFGTTLKGEHILLRQYAFVSSTNINRKCFLQQVKKVFHTHPFFKVVTALDYHQMLCLICSDFPRSLMIEAARILPTTNAPLTTSSNQTVQPDSSNEQVSQKTGDQLLFQKYQLGKIQQTIAIFFYYNEFMEGVRGMFLELQKGQSLSGAQESLDISLRHSCSEMFLMIKDYQSRQKSQVVHPMPSLEVLLQIFLGQTKCKQLCEKYTMILPEEAKAELDGTISYLQFAQEMTKNAKLIKFLFEPVYNKRLASLHEKLKQMALDPVISHNQGKKGKGKKKKI